MTTTQPSEIITPENASQIKTIGDQYLLEILSWLKDGHNAAKDLGGMAKDSIIEGGIATKGFLIEQVPLVVKEIITWGIVKYSIFSIVAFIVAMIFSIFAYKTLKGEKIIDYVPFNIFSVIFALFSWALFVQNIYNLSFVYFAPRLYLITTISQMVKGVH